MHHHTEFDSPAGALGTLQAGEYVRSDVEPEDAGVPWMGRPVHLHGGDVYCDACRDLIDPRTQFTTAWVNVLARQKKEYGGTWCEACFTADAHLKEVSGR
jgi:hypothetical protein